MKDTTRLSRDEKEIKYQLSRELKIRRAKTSFWAFCQVLEPDFYKEDRKHLKILCDSLQGVYESTIINPKTNKPYRKIMINMPPRHGKSRTLILFCMWILGINNENRIISCSYNDDQASDFSRYVRDGIMQKKNLEYEVIFKDIFAKTKIKDGNASFQKWALDGQFFNYIGTGLQGSLTGKGAKVILSDDLVKDSEVAFNEIALDKIWQWYTGTFLSRKEQNCMEIMNMTRWSKKDPCGRILATKDSVNWLVLKMEAYNERTGKMLCDELLNKDDYDFMADPENFDNAIFRANYHQEPLDIKGQLYNFRNFYKEIPNDIVKTIAFADTADMGKDYLSIPVADVDSNDNLYIKDWLYTREPFEITENKTVELIKDNNIQEMLIESNSGGRQFARNIERLVQESRMYCLIDWFHQTENKMGRILSKSSNVESKVFFPEDFPIKYREVWGALLSFQKDGKNKNDDAPDSLTGLFEMVNNGSMAVWEM
jgi:predicted phage terminase large subunit-like protein